jgi:2-dehydropantoate 2-reductase
MLRAVDSAKVTTNLWGERWSKLVANTMTTGLCAILGMSFNAMVAWGPARRVQIRLAAEAIRIGTALGFGLEPIRGMPAETWLGADDGDPVALAQIEESMRVLAARRTGEGRSGTAQDIAKGRRTEVDFMSGYVAARGEAAGIPAPTHAAIAVLVRQMERGELQPSQALVERF